MFNKRKLLSFLSGTLVSLPMLVSAETVFEEVRVTYDSGGQDSLTSSAVDRDGNMYITGVRRNDARGVFTAKYDSYGREKWVRHSSDSVFGGNKMTTDRKGHSYVALTGNLGNVLKYDADGNETILSDRRVVPYGCCSRQVGLVLDHNENNLYSWASHTIQKINLNGDVGWTQQLHFANHLVRDIAVDDFDNIYVVGHSVGHLSEIIVKKIDSQGNVIWSQFWHEENRHGERAYGLELDSNNNIYILLHNLSSEDTCLNCASSSVISYSSDGHFLNRIILNGYLAGSIKVADDKVYVVMRNRSAFTMVVQKLDTDLSQIWSSTEFAVGSNILSKLDADGVGNVVVGFMGPDSRSTITKFDMNGSELWTIKGEGRGRPPAFVKFALGGNVYAADSYLDVFMYRYDVTPLICQ